jgi:DNA helicase-2/ATP-dependent DNA helicase PcrA
MQRTQCESIQQRLAGDENVVLVEAPAGHGKTWLAVALTEQVRTQLQRGQRVLLLSHTNAAREEVRRRFGGAANTRVQTIDSLACDIVSVYASRLGVPHPLRPGAVHLGHPSFEKIRSLACDLLRDAPDVARGLAWRYPVIIVDEHQDSTYKQHELVWRIFRIGGVRLRLFADPLQAIFSFAGDLVKWSELLCVAPSATLSHGYRWDGQPDLRDFLSAARSSLLAREPVDLGDLPPCVQLHHWSGRAPGPGQRGHSPACLQLLRSLSRPVSSAYLVRNRQNAYGLAVRLGGLIKLYEAGDVQEPLDVLERAETAEGDAPALAQLLAETLSSWGTGIQKDLREQLARACHAEGIELGRRKRLAPLAEVCAPLFSEPSVGGFISAFRHAVTSRKELGWMPVRRDATFLMLSIPPQSEDPILALSAMAQAHRSRTGPLQKVMTVHKSKGREFHTVLLPYLASTCFPADEEGTRLAYVGLSRAQSQLHLLAPSQGASELFSW